MGHIILEKYHNCLHWEAVNYLPISRWKHSPRQKRIFCHIGQEGGSPVHLPAAQKGLWQNRYLQVKRNERQKEHCHCRSSLIIPIDHTHVHFGHCANYFCSLLLDTACLHHSFSISYHNFSSEWYWSCWILPFTLYLYNLHVTIKTTTSCKG